MCPRERFTPVSGIEIKIGRWVVASIALQLQPLIEDTLSMQFFVEGVDREEKAWFQADSVVLRVTGPFPVIGMGTTRYRFEAMVMLTDLVDDSSNAFANHDRLGEISNSLAGPIPVLKHGDGGALIGCLDIDRNAKEFLRTVHFGKLNKDTEVVQAAVTAKYEICL